MPRPCRVYKLREGKFDTGWVRGQAGAYATGYHASFRDYSGVDYTALTVPLPAHPHR